MSADIELDDEAKALAEAIDATPEEHQDEDLPVEKPVKKGMSGAMKIMLGGASLLLVAMAGAFLYNEMNTPVPVKRVTTPPKLSVEAPVAVQTPTPAVTLPPATATAPVTTQTVPVEVAPVAQADPFKTNAAPVVASVVPVEPVTSVVPEKPVVTSTVVKKHVESSDVQKVKPKHVKVVQHSKIKKVKEVDNGYVQLF